MKTKLLFAIALLLIVQMTKAQTFGIKGGVNIANMTISAMGMSVSPSSITGFHIGVVGDFNVQGNLFLNTGLLYSLKGASFVGDKMTLNYLEVPINIAYKFPISTKSKFVVEAGPYLGYALSGKDKSGGVSTNVEFGSGGMKRFDYGIGFGAGVEFGSLIASLNYELGLANLIDSSSLGLGSGADGKAKNKVFQISLAYMFGKGK